jgi:hypothetical protein
MNIEVYEAKVKSRRLNKIEKNRKAQEHKEAVEKETRAARHLCAEYHQKLDKERSYFDSGAMTVAKNLLPRFRKLDTKLLPNSVALTILHRKTYLGVMVRLSKSKNISGFLDVFSKKAKKMGVLSKNVEKFKEGAAKTSEYKKLNAKDFLFARRVLKKGMRDLTPLLSVNNFRASAKRYLQPPNAAIKDKRVDDYTAAKKLYNSFKFIEAGIAEVFAAKRKEAVLNPDKAIEIIQKKKTKKA